MELYHIHRSNRFDDQFYEGNTIKFGEEINALRINYMERECTVIESLGIKDGREQILHVDLEDRLDYDYIASLPKDKQIELLKSIKRYVHNSKIDNREIILEHVRRELFPDKPSRYTCAWLTDESDLDMWIKELSFENNNLQIYQVEADGIIFVSSDSLLPDMHKPSYMMYEQAIDYWCPKSFQLDKGKEYLFEGNLVLKKRVK